MKNVNFMPAHRKDALMRTNMIKKHNMMISYPEYVRTAYEAIEASGFNFSTDSRKITPGCVFFALRGENFDGNDFASQALGKGASLAVVDDASRFSASGNTLLVDDVLTALQNVAAYHRMKMNVPVLCLTGSNGKTTTKELIRAVLSRKYNVCATAGNLNNHIGVPLTLLSIRPEHDFAVVEMGASHPREIAVLSAIARPDYGVITNFGRAHLEGFGGVEGVIKTKSELYDFLRENGGVAFVNADDNIQTERSEGMERYLFSSREASSADVHITMETSLPVVTGSFGGLGFSTHLSGKYNFTNACAAIAVGTYFGVAPDLIAAALDGYVPDNNRSQWMEKNGNIVMLDAYNANPTSMSLSVENFAQADTRGLPKVAVLGDMFELGSYALEEHGKIAALAAGLPFAEVYLIGENFHKIPSPATNVHIFRGFGEFAAAFAPKVPAAYLIKGSRGMAMERTLDLI